MSILSAQDISKSFKLRKVVKNLSLEIRSGEVVGLLGPNGAGKTTAFYMIVGLITADSGNILLDDQDLTTQPMHKRAKLGLGYLPQEASIFRKLTVEQNILAILENRDDLDQDPGIGRVPAWESASPTVSGGGWKSPGRSPLIRYSCCSMNPLPGSTRSRSSIFNELSSIYLRETLAC